MLNSVFRCLDRLDSNVIFCIRINRSNHSTDLNIFKIFDKNKWLQNYENLINIKASSSFPAIKKLQYSNYK